MLRRAFIFCVLISIPVLLDSCCKAGTGGNATIVCHVTSTTSGQPINDAIVYIYYGSSKPPANMNGFSDSKKTGTNNNTATFTGLKCGTYYLYATSFDTTIKAPIQGGGPYSLKHSKRNKSGDAYISVSF